MSENKLKDKNIFPSNDVLKDILGDSFIAFNKLNEILSLHEIIPEWNYYRDGNAWLCKLLFKKKNLGWLHVYDRYFMVTCYFMERHFPEIENLNIAENIKENFYNMNTTGRLIPMPVTIREKELPDDVMTMILFKKGLR